MWLDDVRQYLISSGITWPVYIGYLPSETDRAIALYPTGGYPADTLGRENELPTFQAAIRSSKLDFLGGFNQWKAVFDALQDATATGALLAGFTFIQAMATGPLQYNDPNGRPVFTANFRVKKNRS